MVDNNDGAPNMDLAAILATLANLQQQPNVSAPQILDQQYGQSYDSQSYPQHPIGQPYQPQAPADPRLLNRSTSQQVAALPKPQDRSSTALVDPATITEWKKGLRCVSKIATQNPDFAASIRKLMKEQEGNVKQWENGRTLLIEDHKVKRENEIAHRAALSLPGLLENTPMLRTTEREQAELHQYDAKVYRACKAMAESQTSSLKVLGVPFFGTRPQLVLHESQEVPSAEDAAAGKISKTQHLDLQRKMLNHLMELYGD